MRLHIRRTQHLVLVQLNLRVVDKLCICRLASQRLECHAHWSAVQHMGGRNCAVAM
jgi:hypothetical protein